MCGNVFNWTLFNALDSLAINNINMKKPPFKECPTCSGLGESGKIILIDKIDRNGKRVKFYGCSNYDKGCRYIYSSRAEKELKELENKLKRSDKK